MHDTPVLIIGGSLVGLSTALFLAWRGVPVTLIEKHTGSMPHPRAMGFTEHTLECFRAVGLQDAIPQTDPHLKLRRAQVHDLFSLPLSETYWTPGQDAEEKAHLSPVSGAAIPQDVLEPLLRDAARQHGAHLRLGVELIHFTQDASGVTAHVRDKASGHRQTLRADYLIAADGANSPIREQLGIPRCGVGHLRVLRSVLFYCREADDVLRQGIQQFDIEQPDFKAFMTTYGDSRWVLMFEDDQPRDEAALHAAIHKALGRPLAFEIITTGCWELAGRIAERYQDGRIFLVGDAAHQLPPTRGGFGANTGIADAYNLAWKLQHVLLGKSLPTLLDTYSPERQPIGWLRHQQTFARPDYAHWVDHSLHDEALLGDAALELGQLHRSSAIIGAGSELPPAAHPDLWAGQPGTRVPHIWIKAHGTTCSTLDLCSNGFSFWSADPDWYTAAVNAQLLLGVPLQIHQVGRDVTFTEPDAFHHKLGVPTGGAMLIRPDGIVCWRSDRLPAHPTAHLCDVMRQVACLPT